MLCCCVSCAILMLVYRSVRSAGPYHDTSEEGKFYAVVLEQIQGYQEISSGNVGSP